MAQLYKDTAKAGKVYEAYSAFVYTRGDDGRFRGVSVASNVANRSMQFTLTGVYMLANDGTRMYQTTTGSYIDMSDGWEQKSEIFYSPAQAQEYINKLIENNKHVLQNNLFCARFAHHLSEQQKQTLYGLQERLQDRDTQLRTDGYVSSVNTSTPPGYTDLTPYLVSFMNSGVGLVLSTTSVIVISCVVIASLSTAAYFAYKALYDESAKDVKFSDDLTRVLLSKLTEEEYQQLLSETQGMVTRANIRGRLHNTLNIGKFALIGLGCYFVYKMVAGAVKDSKKKSVKSDK